MFIKIKVGKEERCIPYTLGVQQGDNMTLLLFLIPTRAFGEILEKKWINEWGIESPEYKYFQTKKTERGRLLGQATKSAGTSFDLFYQLYMDDGGFLFTNKADMIKGAELIHDHFAEFGLKIHIGRDGGKSKTEAMYCPQSLQAEKYLELDLDEKVPVRDGYITFTQHFKYLGSWISDTLQDDYELDIRLKRAKGQMGSLKPFFRCPGIELATKYKVYMAIPVNTALWGCESWSMTEKMRRRIRAFHHQSI